jgi:predicted enzyme related to lactoylglutathione lyase
VVIAVEDIREHMMNVEKSGGKVLGEPVDIQGVGLYRFLIRRAIG